MLTLTGIGTRTLPVGTERSSMAPGSDASRVTVTAALGPWDVEPERRSTTELAIPFDGPAEEIDQTLDHREAHTPPSQRSVCRSRTSIELLPYAWLFFKRDSRTIVRHLNSRPTGADSRARKTIGPSGAYRKRYRESGLRSAHTDRD